MTFSNVQTVDMDQPVGWQIEQLINSLQMPDPSNRFVLYFGKQLFKYERPPNMCLPYVDDHAFEAMIMRLSAGMYLVEYFVNLHIY
jgi:hypothetical protein